MLLVVRKIAGFIASPSGILVTLGLLAVASATATTSPGIRFWMGVVGSVAAMVGIARRFITSEERSHQTKEQLRDAVIHIEKASGQLEERLIRRLRSGEVRTTSVGRDARNRIEAVERRIENQSKEREKDRAVVEEVREAALREQRSREREIENQSKEREKDRAVVEEVREAALREQRSRERELEKERTAPKEVSIDDVRLVVLGGYSDADWYDQRSVHEERQSPLYDLVHQGGFQSFVDVGANYGFVSILARRAAPSIHVVAIEADPRLMPLISINLERNGVSDADVVHAIAGATVDGTTTFSLDPNSTLDNRVRMDSWDKIPVAQLTLDSIIDDLTLPNPIFLKVDTQGFEAEVLAGATSLLSNRNDWMIKMEFGPLWLRSQSVDPAAFLGDLCGRFDVVEFPARVAFAEQSLDSIFRDPIESSISSSFVDYVASLNQHGRGWVDLLVRPRLHPHQ